MMSTKSFRHLKRLPLYIFWQTTIRPTLPRNISHHAIQVSLYSTPSHATKDRSSALRFRVPANRNSFEHVRFTAADAPPLSFWEAYTQPPLVPPDSVTPSACHEACRKYVSLSLEDGANWRSRCPSLFTLHYVAVILINSSGNKDLAMHVLHTGVTQGYAPTVLTTARLALKAGKLGRPQFEIAKEALERLSYPVSSNANRGNHYRPDALTLSGLAASSMNTPKDTDRALKLFSEAAASFASSPGSSWQWRASAVLEHSKILLRQKRPDLARAVLGAQVRDLDNAEACHAYAMLLPPSDPERLALLERAAISGVEAAARELARVELERAAEPRLSKREQRDRRIIADEWLRIAGDEAVA
ncbi:hypothetical protein F4781DRAFT_386276 [Annulohypoxylon bovei var. microspora]|nr:hypothetical protein F4781DRAFT_386276 [Annulohypoxylon bovei var. microspora]